MVFLPLHLYPGNQALSLRQQVEGIKRERVAMGMEVDSPCGPGAPCKARIEAMVAAHRTALQELQDKHGREIRELEAHRDRLLQEESQGSSRGEGTLRGCVVKHGGLYYERQTTSGI